jgi:hypothetical protein
LITLLFAGRAAQHPERLDDLGFGAPEAGGHLRDAQIQRPQFYHLDSELKSNGHHGIRSCRDLQDEYAVMRALSTSTPGMQECCVRLSPSRTGWLNQGSAIAQFFTRELRGKASET